MYGGEEPSGKDAAERVIRFFEITEVYARAKQTVEELYSLAEIS